MFEVVADDGHFVDDLIDSVAAAAAATEEVCARHRGRIVVVVGDRGYDLFHGEEDVRVFLFDFVDAAERARTDYFVDGIVVYVVCGRLGLIAYFYLEFESFHVFFIQLVKGLNQRLIHL
jgi:hypothetical protein